MEDLTKQLKELAEDYKDIKNQLKASESDIVRFVCENIDRIQISELPADSREEFFIWKPDCIIENISLGCYEGECKCHNTVKSTSSFCDRCGTKLDWSGCPDQEKCGLYMKNTF